MPQRIATVLPASLAYRHGLLPGDALRSINGEAVLDQVDYQYLIDTAHAALELERPNGEVYHADIHKAPEEPLGLTFDQDLMRHPKQCANDCVFCFVSQLPRGLRPSLYVKDDDWRLSLMTGNYITLTNLPEREIDRIIARHATPLYISVHTTDPALRVRMMHNKRAGNILPLLQRFAEAGLSFHCQIVSCPGLNDGPALDRTLAELSALAPHALSVAVVPVGLTRHREGLTPLHPYTPEAAMALLSQIHAWQEKLLPKLRTRFVFAADELYLKANLPVPPAEAYEDYPQIENGVGLVRQLEDGFRAARRLLEPEDIRPGKLLLATGQSATPILRNLVREANLPGVTVDIQPITNHFFGETITVAGLVTGQDLITQLRGKDADALLLPAVMLRTGEDVFLDGTPLAEVSEALGLPVRMVGPEGIDLLDALCGIEQTEV